MKGFKDWSLDTGRPEALDLPPIFQSLGCSSFVYWHGDGLCASRD